MPKHSPTRLACVVAAALGAIASASSASAVTPLTSCATLDTFGGSYIVRANLVSCGPCFVIANDRITLDLGAHAVSGECPLFGAGITDDGEPRRFTTVKNGAITGFSFGVNLGASSRSEIRNVQS